MSLERHSLAANGCFQGEAQYSSKEPVPELLQLSSKKKYPVHRRAEDLNRRFPRDDIQMDDRHMKRGSTSVSPGKRKSKPQRDTIPHLSGRLASKRPELSAHRMWGYEDPCLSVGTDTSAATVENSVEFPQKIKNRAALQSRNPTSTHIPKGNENRASKSYQCPHVHCRISYSNQDTETT